MASVLPQRHPHRFLALQVTEHVAFLLHDQPVDSNAKKSIKQHTHTRAHTQCEREEARMAHRQLCDEHVTHKD